MYSVAQPAGNADVEYKNNMCKYSYNDNFVHVNLRSTEVRLCGPIINTKVAIVAADKTFLIYSSARSI